MIVLLALVLLTGSTFHASGAVAKLPLLVLERGLGLVCSVDLGSWTMARVLLALK